MAEFLVEFYISRSGAAALRDDADRARRAAEQLTGEGTRARYLRSMFLPEDETCFFLYEAESAAAVCAAVQRAQLPAERLSELG